MLIQSEPCTGLTNEAKMTCAYRCISPQCYDEVYAKDEVRVVHAGQDDRCRSGVGGERWGHQAPHVGSLDHWLLMPSLSAMVNTSQSKSMLTMAD